MSKIINPNFHKFSHSSVFDERQDERFKEYRKRWNEYPTNKIVGSFPIHLDIESTYRCNLKCQHCARTSDNWGPEITTDLDMSLYKKVIDEGAVNNLYSIKLSLRGEPLLHSGIVDMVKYAKDRGILDVYFNTNGVFLTDKLINELIDAKLDRISISIDGLDTEYFENIRKPIKYIDMIEKVKLLKDIRESREVDYPKIRVQTVLDETTKKEINRYTNFWKKYADEVSGIDMRKEGRNWRYKITEADWYCQFLWQRMTILCDGTILPCLLHGIKNFSKYSLGNICDTDIKDAWNSNIMNFMRNMNQKKKGHLMDVCNKCSFRASELEKLGYDTCYIDR
jgi:MoaA/NifB/PqqE/SkfB family radical SAM enzyme